MKYLVFYSPVLHQTHLLWTSAGPDCHGKGNNKSIILISAAKCCTKEDGFPRGQPKQQLTNLGVVLLLVCSLKYVKAFIHNKSEDYIDQMTPWTDPSSRPSYIQCPVKIQQYITSLSPHHHHHTHTCLLLTLDCTSHSFKIKSIPVT